MCIRDRVKDNHSAFWKFLPQRTALRLIFPQKWDKIFVVFLSHLQRCKSICTLGISLCLILWDDFLSDVHKFMRRTWSVRWLNLGASGGKSAAKAGAERFREYIIMYSQNPAADRRFRPLMQKNPLKTQNPRTSWSPVFIFIISRPNSPQSSSAASSDSVMRLNTISYPSFP